MKTLDQVPVASSSNVATTDKSYISKRVTPATSLAPRASTPATASRTPPKFKISTCSRYDSSKPKAFNNSRVTSGWELRSFPWEPKVLASLFSLQGICTSELRLGIKRKANHLSTHALMLDFDNGEMTYSAALQEQAAWKFASYIFVSQNHLINKTPDGTPIDKIRVFIPLSSPITSTYALHSLESVFLNRYPTELDRTFLQPSRYFAHGRTDEGLCSISPAEKPFLDWTSLTEFRSKLSPSQQYTFNKKTKEPIEIRPREARFARFFFSLNDEVITADGRSSNIRSLPGGTRILCPVCGNDESLRSSPGLHNAVLGINNKGIPMIYCSSCESRGEGISGKGVYNLDVNGNYEYATIINTAAGSIPRMVFLDKSSGNFTVCEPDVVTGQPELTQISGSEVSLKSHCMNLGIPFPKEFPIYSVITDFSSDTFIDHDKQLINRYYPTRLLSLEPIPGEDYASPPSTIAKLIAHVTASTPGTEISNRFYNDLAYMVQKRERLITSFLLQGTEGTGKGMLFETIFPAIFGPKFVSQTDQSTFGNQFNSQFENTVCMLINEVHGDYGAGSQRTVAVIDKIKMAITDETVEIEAKGQNRRQGKNMCSFFFACNVNKGLILSKDDRRFNICPRQTVKVHNTSWWHSLGGHKAVVAAINKELPTFVRYLKTLEIDMSLIATVCDNEAKRALQGLSSTHTEDFVELCNAGDIPTLIELCAATTVNQSPDDIENEKYIIATLKTFTSEKNTPASELAKVYNHIYGKKLSLPAFRKLMTGMITAVRTRHNYKRQVSYPLPWKAIPGNTCMKVVSRSQDVPQANRFSEAKNI